MILVGGRLSSDRRRRLLRQYYTYTPQLIKKKDEEWRVLCVCVCVGYWINITQARARREM